MTGKPWMDDTTDSDSVSPDTYPSKTGEQVDITDDHDN